MSSLFRTVKSVSFLTVQMILV